MNQKSNLWVLLLLILLLVAAVALLLHALFKPLPAAPQKPAPTAAQEAAEPTAAQEAAEPAASPAETAPQVSETSPKKAELIRRLKETFGQVFPGTGQHPAGSFLYCSLFRAANSPLRAQKILQQRTEPVDEKVTGANVTAGRATPYTIQGGPENQSARQYMERNGLRLPALAKDGTRHNANLPHLCRGLLRFF